MSFNPPYFANLTCNLLVSRLIFPVQPYENSLKKRYRRVTCTRDTYVHIYMDPKHTFMEERSESTGNEMSRVCRVG